MAVARVIDVESLLIPISEEQPAGLDPRENASPLSGYFTVKDARAAARAAERGATDADALTPEEWGTVESSASELLASTAKDLEIASWLTEAAVREHGFEGLRDGLDLIRGLVDGFWETVFPLPDEDGLETRLSAVAGLNGSGAPGTLIQPLRMLTLFGVERPVSIWHYDQAQDADRLTDDARKKARYAAGVYTMEQLRQALAETSSQDLTRTLASVEECRASLGAMSASLDAVAGVDSPPVSALRELLDAIATSIRYFGAGRILEAAPAADEAIDEPSAGPEGAGGEGGSGGGGEVRMRKVDGFASREEALQALTAITTYFRKTEPQSPISYTLEEAVRRARMTLPELLQELTGDPSQIRTMLTAAGIRAPSDEGG